MSFETVACVELKKKRPITENEWQNNKIESSAFLKKLRGTSSAPFAHHGTTTTHTQTDTHTHIMVSKMAPKTKPVDNSVNERRLRPIYGK